MSIKNLQIFSFSIALLLAFSFNSIKAYAYGPFPTTSLAPIAAPVIPTAPLTTPPVAAPITPTAPLTPPPVAAPVIPTAPLTPPQKICCVCSHYTDVSCSSKDYWSCSKNCEWSGGKCISSTIFKTWCDNWFKSDETKDCTDTAYNEVKSNPGVETRLGDPTGGFKGCTLVKNKYFGHGLGCEGTFKYISVCVDSDDPNDFIFDFKGCRTFQDLSAAWKYAGEVQGKLGTSQCINVTADQSLIPPNENNCSRTTYNIKITKRKTCGKAGTCNFGGSCHKPDEKGLCTKENTDGTTTTTCKKCTYPWYDLFGNYQWAEAPLSECQSEPGPVLVPTTGNEETTNGLDLDEE